MNANFKNLVFEGGGVKGIAYGGALEILDNMNILTGVQRVAGTSAGAITACLLSVGYTSEEIAKELKELNFASFKDRSWFGPNNIFRVWKKYGYYKGDFFIGWLGDRIKNKTGNKDYTFKQLQTDIDKGGKNLKQLFVISTNLTLQKPAVFSAETTPDCTLKQAVRMSMSIPIFFQSISENKNIFVDGGVSWNYPINIFDNLKFIPKQGNYEKVDYGESDQYVFNHETLGFRLDSKSVIDYAKNNWSIPPQPFRGLKEYSLALVNFMSEMANKSHLHSNDWSRTIFIDTGNIQTTQFDLSAVEIQSLIQNGKTYTTKYFDWRKTDEKLKLLPV